MSMFRIPHPKITKLITIVTHWYGADEVKQSDLLLIKE
jgi:hypothetical protein